MSLLLTWHAKRGGMKVLEDALQRLRNRRVQIDRVLYLVQESDFGRTPNEVDGALIEAVSIAIEDPTSHMDIYQAVRNDVLPRLADVREAHVNVSPGTPAMHAVWLVLHAGGALPAETKLWSSQYNPDTKRTRIDRVEFPVTTYLAEIRREARLAPDVAVYELECRSAARSAALETLARYARVAGAPLLVLGERGTGKTRLVESIVATLKGRPPVPVPCGALDPEFAESILFGHRKGAFTGAVSDRQGLLAEAHRGVLFLDEIQDLPVRAQRKLIRVFQDRRRRYRPVGADKEKEVDAELVCASNLPMQKLRDRLDPDLYDRVSHLVVEVPPLRETRDDLPDDWRRVWREMRATAEFPEEPPTSKALERAWREAPLPGNLRDLQKLAALVMAWWHEGPEAALDLALEEWGRTKETMPGRFGEGSRQERIASFKRELALWARGQYGTWSKAAKMLGCDEKTLRADARDPS